MKWLREIIPLVAMAVACVVYVHATFVTYRTYDSDISHIRQGISNIYTILAGNRAQSPADEIEQAWKRATELGGAPAWLRRPEVELRDGVRYVPGMLGYMRLCGETSHYIIPDPAGAFDGYSILSEVRVYMLPDEPRMEVLVHEFLHAIWIVRANSEEAFPRQYPDSEEWVVMLLPAQCPNR